MGARLLGPSDVAGRSGPTSSEQMARAAVARGSGWGRGDGARPAARGGAAALTAGGGGRGRPAGPARTQHRAPRVLGSERGAAGRPLSRGLGPAG